MKRKKGNILIFLLVGFAVIFATGIGFFYRRNQQLTNKETPLSPAPREVIQKINPGANWKTFVNITNNYLVKYPSDEEGPMSGCGGMLMHFNPAESCPETGFAGVNYQIRDYPAKLSFESLVSYLTERGKTEDKKPVEIAGKQAFELKYKGWLKTTPSIDEKGELTSGGQLYDDKQKLYYLKLSDREYMTIQYSLEICQEQTSGGLYRDIPCKPRGGLETSEEIIKTLSFFDKTALDFYIAKYWEQFRNENMGFELKIPPAWKAYSNKSGDYVVFSPDRELADDKIKPGEDRYYLDLSIQVAGKETDLYKTPPTDYKLVRKTSIDFAGQKAGMAIYSLNKRGYIDDFPTETVFNRNNKWFMIRYLSGDKDGFRDPVFDKILETFKYLD